MWNNREWFQASIRAAHKMRRTRPRAEYMAFLRYLFRLA